MTLDDEAEDELRRICFTYSSTIHLSLFNAVSTQLELQTTISLKYFKAIRNDKASLFIHFLQWSQFIIFWFLRLDWQTTLE